MRSLTSVPASPRKLCSLTAFAFNYCVPDARRALCDITCSSHLPNAVTAARTPNISLASHCVLLARVRAAHTSQRGKNHPKTPHPWMQSTWTF